MKEEHGHKILELIELHFKGEPFTDLRLQNLVVKNIGNVKYYNCHGSGFSLHDLVDFFVEKGKLERENGKLKLAKINQCECSH